MMNKRGQTGDSVVTMYRVFVVVFVSVVVLGVSSIIYSYHINIRDSEAMLLVREISDCVISEGVVDLGKLKVVEDVFEYCGFDKNEMENFFVSVVVKVEGKDDFRIEGGDSGLLWVKDIYGSGAETGAIDRYEPGHFEWTYSVLVLDGDEKDGEVVVEVIANVEAD